MAIVKTLVNAVSRTVTASSASFAKALKPLVEYRLVADVDFWYELDTDSATLVAAEDGAVFVPAGSVESLIPPQGGGLYLYVIRAAGVDGIVNLAEVSGVEV